MFSTNYKPILGANGILEIILSSNEVFSLSDHYIPPGANMMTVSCRGGLINYYNNGENPSNDYGRPIPDATEVFLPNAIMIRNFKAVNVGADPVAMTLTFLIGT